MKRDGDAYLLGFAGGEETDEIVEGAGEDAVHGGADVVGIGGDLLAHVHGERGDLLAHIHGDGADLLADGLGGVHGLLSEFIEQYVHCNPLAEVYGNKKE